MADYESMTREELIDAIHRLEAKQNEVHPPGQLTSIECEYALLQSERELFFERSPQPMFIHDRNTLQMLRVNNAALWLYGYAREEFLSLKLSDIRPAEEIPFLLRMHHVPTGYMHYRGARRHRRKCGELVEVEVFAQDVLFDRKPARVTLLIDSTERRHVIDELQKRERAYATLAENAPVIIARIDRDFRHLYVNRAVTSLTGHPPEFFLGKTHAEIGIPDHLVDQWHDALERAFDTATQQEIEFEFAGISGTKVFESVIVPEYGSFGHVVTVLVIANDVTHRRSDQTELRQQKQLLDAIIDNLPVGLSIKDAHSFRFLRRNRFSEALSGYRHEECVNKTVHEAFSSGVASYTHREDLRALAMRATLEIPEREVAMRSGEIRIHHARKVPILDDRGEPQLLVTIFDDITERKRAENKVRESERFARSVLDALSKHICVIDSTGTIVAVNKAWREFATSNGAYSNVMEGANYLSACDSASATPEAAPLVEGIRSVMKAERDQFSFEYRCDSPTQRRWFVANVTRFHGEGPLRLVITHENISERKFAENALKASETNYRNVVETSRDVIWSADADGRLIFINQAVREVYGYDSAEMLGMRIADVLDPLRVRKGFTFFREMLTQDRTVPDYECEAVRKDGSRIILSTNAVVLRDEHGVLTGFTGISKDITLQKSAGLALRESEERFRLLAENMREVFWICALGSGETLYLSPAFEEIWGMTREELYRDARAWLHRVHPEDLPAALEIFEAVKFGRNTITEYRVVRPDGEVRWIWDRSYAMTTAAGKALVCGIAEDITERKSMETARLAREVEQRETLIREVHHRIKNHLQGIAGLLRQKVKGNAALLPLIDSAVAELHSVAAVFGLRDDVNGGRAELRTMLEAIIASVQGVTGGRVAFEDELEQPVFVAENEKVPLALMLNELIFNSLKHSSETGATKNVKVSMCEHNGHYQISVTNTGKLAAGFDFARGAGIGLGLELVQSLLPSKSASLAFSQTRGSVTTVLTLHAPLVAYERAIATPSARSVDRSVSVAERTL